MLKQNMNKGMFLYCPHFQGPAHASRSMSLLKDVESAGPLMPHPSAPSKCETHRYSPARLEAFSSADSILSASPNKQAVHLWAFW